MSVSATPDERGPSRRLVEVAVAAILIVLAIMALFDSYGRGAGWDNGPENGYFPARVAWLFLASAVFILASGLRRPDTVLVTWRQLSMVGRVLGPLVAFVALIGPLGIYVASAIFTVIFMVITGQSRWWSILLTAVLVPVACFYVFEIQFVVPLPKGPVEAWLGY